MSTRNLPGGKGRPAHGPDNLTTSCEPIIEKMWESRRLTTLWAFTAYYRDSITFLFLNSLLSLKNTLFSGKINRALDKVRLYAGL
jgi:hypothetical protein